MTERKPDGAVVVAKDGWKLHSRFSDIRRNGLIEAICPHGVGHHRGVHGCDGCCKDALPEMWKETTNECD